MITGPTIYRNWLAYDDHETLQASFEFPLFTDAHIIGQIDSGLGPYKLLNPVVSGGQYCLARPSVILFFNEYLKGELPEMGRTDAGNYHGGMLPDEAAALVSLIMGIRLKAGGRSREFDPDGDPKGRPVGWDLVISPQILPASYGVIVPSACGEHSLEPVQAIMPSIPELSADGSVALIRAARLYQDAIWIIESDPNLAWLFLISAIEVAANHWKHDKGEALDHMRAWDEEFSEQLETRFGDEAASFVANKIAGTTGVAKKFAEFIIRFLPQPPSDRPTDLKAMPLQHSWGEEDLRKSMTTIYNYRSRALHDGTPFPAPMCEPPFNRPPEERPMGLAACSRGGTWLASDTPMMLHLFEYIARKCLLGWWDFMAHNLQNGN